MITTDNVLNMVPRDEEADPYFALGILNSRLISWLYVNTSTIAQKDDFPQVYISALANLPIPSSFRKQRTKLVKLVETMLALQDRIGKVKTSHDRNLIQRQIDTTNKQIDQLVYELYGLTDEEIRIVEEATK